MLANKVILDKKTLLTDKKSIFNKSHSDDLLVVILIKTKLKPRKTCLPAGWWLH